MVELGRGFVVVPMEVGRVIWFRSEAGGVEWIYGILDGGDCEY